MQTQDINLEWIADNYGDFFLKYCITSKDITNQFLDWYKTNKSEPISKYLFHLLSQVGLLIAKSASTVKEGYEWKIELSEKLLQYSLMFQKDASSFWVKQIKFDRKQLEKFDNK